MQKLNRTSLMMNKTVVYFLLLTAFLCSSVCAQITQTVEISSSPNPVGSGARALGMGGAFIGVADDATAASWNPGGLIQLETPEMSLVLGYNYRKENTSYRAFPEASGPQDVSTRDINYLSAAYPFSLFGKNMIVSLNWQHLYDFNKKVNYAYNLSEPFPPYDLHQVIDYKQEGSFKSISPAMAIQITPAVSVGMTLNIWRQDLYDNKWDVSYRSLGNGTFVGFPFNSQTRIDESYAMEGLNLEWVNPSEWQNINFNLGLMWSINQTFTLGAVFKSPFEARLKHDYHYWSTLTYPTYPAGNTTDEFRNSEKVTLDMPMAYGLGLAIRLSDQFTMDVDVYQTRWSDYALQDESGAVTNPITGKPQSESDVGDTVQIRTGLEYLFMPKQKYIVPFRAGLFYDPEPADNSPDDFFGFSLGSGIVYKKIVLDMAYQFRFGRGVRTTTVGDEDSSQDVDQHTLYASVIYHF